MRFLQLIFLVVLWCSNIAHAQNTVSVDSAIDFPTINLEGEEGDLNVPDHSEQVPDNMKPNMKKKKTELVKGKNYGFYNDIIIGSIVLVVGWIGWQLYQRFRR